MKTLKDIHNQVKQHKSWADYFKWNHLQQVSDEERDRQLIICCQKSIECGYHGGNKSKGKKRY